MVSEQDDSNHTLDFLVPDIWIDVFQQLTIQELVKAKLVCRRMKELISIRIVWVNAIKLQIEGDGLSLARLTKPPAEYSSEELEALAVQTMRFAVNLAQPSPVPTSWTEYKLPPRRSNSPHIAQVFFLAGESGTRWAVCASGGYRLSIHEVLPDPVNIIPAFDFVYDDLIVEMVPNVIPNLEATIAYTMREKDRIGTYRAVICNVSRLDSGRIPVVDEVELLKGPPGSLHLLRGDWLFFHRKRIALCTAINYKTKQRLEFQEPPRGVNEPQEGCRSLMVHDNHLVMVTSEKIHVWDYNEAATKRSLPLFTHVLSLSNIMPFKAETASMIPYVREWKMATYVRTEEGEGLLCLVRRRNSAVDDEVYNFLIVWRPDQPNGGVSVNCFRRARVSPHYCTIIKYALTGRGMIMCNFREDDGTMSEALYGFDIRRRDPTGRARDVAEARWRPISRVTVPENAVIRCSTLDYDDTEGRVVMGSPEGKLIVFDFA